MSNGLEGASLTPILQNPNNQGKDAVFSQFPRSKKGNRHRKHGDIMGYAVRTKRYRYVEWRDWESKRVIATELYDHQSDPLETRNVANDIDYVNIKKELVERVRN